MFIICLSWASNAHLYFLFLQQPKKKKRLPAARSRFTLPRFALL